MTFPELESLVRIGKLREEPGTQTEFDGLLRSGFVRLTDAKNSALSFESRFDLAYNAAHSLALAALRWHGYRSDNRYVVFQVIPHTLGLGPEVWKVLAECHRRRNQSEYEGVLEEDKLLLTDLIAVTERVCKEVKQLDNLQASS